MTKPNLLIAALALIAFTAILFPAAARIAADISTYGKAMTDLDKRLDAMESR